MIRPGSIVPTVRCRQSVFVHRWLKLTWSDTCAAPSCRHLIANPSASSPPRFCATHKCQEPSCAFSRRQGSTYCVAHACRVASCPGTLTANPIHDAEAHYCEAHECRATGCHGLASTPARLSVDPPGAVAAGASQPRLTQVALCETHARQAVDHLAQQLASFASQGQEEVRPRPTTASEEVLGAALRREQRRADTAEQVASGHFRARASRRGGRRREVSLDSGLGSGQASSTSSDETWVS